MNMRPFQILPGPTLILGNAAVRLTPTDGLGLAEDLARVSFRGVLEAEADRFAAAARVGKRKNG